MNQIDHLRAPLFVSWQITRDCDLCCLHCCTDSAPGKRLADELDAAEALKLADEIIKSGVLYVMLCGGEAFTTPRHVWWNFVSSSRDRINQAKDDWNAGRFPKVPGDDKEFIPIPAVPKTVSYP